jgi:NO-binding membrane sensor protein with MHYT domain
LAFAVACLAEVLLFTLLWRTVGNANTALVVWLAAGAVVGVGTWFAANRQLLKLTATHPQRHSAVSQETPSK